MNIFNCPCVPDLSDNLRAPDTIKSEQEIQFTQLVGTLSFKPTLVGASERQIFKLKNQSEEVQSYITQRNPNTNPIYHAFDFRISQTVVESGDYLECVVIYSPQITRQRNVDYLQILDNHFRLYEVCLKGDCIGPVINISIKTLYFFDTKNSQGLNNTFEIKNVSSVPAAFQLDVNEEDDDQGVFTLNKIRGTLDGYQHTYITVRFVAKKIGFYCKNLFCLITNHMPIMIELIGLKMPNLDFNLHHTTLRRFPGTKDERYGYGSYMYDSVKTTIHKPPFSLSVNYLDFGRVQFQENANNSRILVTSFTNHLSDSLEVIWINDNQGVFSITPEAVVIPPEESVLYECQLKPNLPDHLYSKILTANVYWSNFRSSLKECELVEIIDVPLNLTLTVLGHSFPENKIWLPRIEVCPNVIILPPCMPMVPSYTTFLLKSSGHLPTSFKFIPPKKSNYILKPMEGIIYEFQIVIAQLQPDLNDKKAHVERWGVELNGRTEDCLPFYLKGYSEYASIIVGNNNVVTFATVHPGCQDIVNVMVKNTSIHFIKYNFLVENNNHFQIDHPEGELASNETVFLRWYFTGHPQAAERFRVECEIRITQNTKLIMGSPLHANVTVYAKCAHSELCAIPNGFDFGLVRWGTKHSLEFCLFNFGESTIHFELVPKYEITDFEELTMLPTKGIVVPREKKRIIVHVKALKTGSQEINIVYRVRLNKISDTTIDDGKEYNIFCIQYSCIYPTLQVEDICSHNFGYLFTKISLWDMFNIDELNKALQTICYDETKTVDMYLPDYELGEADFFANLLIRNTTQFSTELKLKRKKICDCQLVPKAKGMSLRERIYDCIHREMLKLELSHEHIEANLTQKLRIDVKYLEHGLTKMLYLINLSDNRKIELNVHVNVLPEKVTRASNYSRTFQFKLNSVYIGENHPPAQVFSLYNNSAEVIHYSIDENPISCVNFEYGFEIFKFLNPNGTILPFTSHDIVLIFVPIEARKYNVVVPFFMGESELSLQISGEGTDVFNPQIHDIAQTLPCSTKAHHKQNPVELSVQHLIPEPFLVWSTIDQMLFIKNQTHDKIIGYSWQSCTVEGIVHAEVVYGKGVLQPKESHAVIIRINSFDQPCHLRLRMVCKLLDHTQHIQHQESLVAYKRKQEELAGQFTITEHGIFYPKNEVVILPKPENFFVTLTISLYIISVADRDLWLTREKQLEQSSQFALHTNLGRILERYFQPLIAGQSHVCTSMIKDTEDDGDDEGNPRTQQHCCKINVNQHDALLFNSVIEYVMADFIFSEMFGKIVDAGNNLMQPYYIQFKMNDDKDLVLTTKADIKKANEKDVETRMNLVKSSLNRPQTPSLTSIFNELFTDSIHQIFKLGPQIKNRQRKADIYHNEKRRFTCSICKCNK